MKILGICLDRRLPQSTLLEVALNILNVSKPSGWTLQSSGEDFSQREITPTGSVSRTKLTNEQYHMDEWTSNGYVQNWCKTATIITAIIVFRRDKSKFNRIWVVSQFVDGFLRLKTSKTPSLKGPTSSCSSFFVFRVAPHFETHEIGKKTTSHRPMACFWHCGHDHGNLEARPWWLDDSGHLLVLRNPPWWIV